MLVTTVIVRAMGPDMNFFWVQGRTSPFTMYRLYRKADCWFESLKPDQVLQVMYSGTEIMEVIHKDVDKVADILRGTK